MKQQKKYLLVVAQAVKADIEEMGQTIENLGYVNSLQDGQAIAYNHFRKFANEFMEMKYANDLVNNNDELLDLLRSGILDKNNREISIFETYDIFVSNYSGYDELITTTYTLIRIE